MYALGGFVDCERERLRRGFLFGEKWYAVVPCITHNVIR